MIDKDKFLLEKAYLSISKPVPSVSTDKEEVVLNPYEGESHSDEEAEMEFVAPVDELESEEGCEGDCSCGGEETMDHEEETEEEDMAISNLNSIRESLMKISTFCYEGGHLHEWQLQKLAICMDNLSEVARRLR